MTRSKDKTKFRNFRDVKFVGKEIESFKAAGPFEKAIRLVGYYETAKAACLACTDSYRFAVRVGPLVIAAGAVALEKTQDLAVKIGRSGSEVFAYVGERVPLPKGFPAPRSFPFGAPTAIPAIAVTPVTTFGQVFKTSDNSTGPSYLPSLPAPEARATIEVGPPKGPITIEGQLG